MVNRRHSRTPLRGPGRTIRRLARGGNMYMKLTGRDIFAAVGEAVGVKPECPIRAVQINTPLDGVATLTVELILTPEMLKQISDAVNKESDDD